VLVVSVEYRMAARDGFYLTTKSPRKVWRHNDISTASIEIDQEEVIRLSSFLQHHLAHFHHDDEP
jgi:hypothetical protein